MDWQTVVAMFFGLVFAAVLLIFLLKYKRIDSENTIRFACIAVCILIIVSLVFVPIANAEVSTALVGVMGTIFGYVIRDIAKKREGE